MNQQSLPMPPKDTFEEDDDSFDFPNPIINPQTGEPSVAEDAPDPQPASSQLEPRVQEQVQIQQPIPQQPSEPIITKVSWVHKWVKVPNIHPQLPPIFVKKWIKSVVEEKGVDRLEQPDAVQQNNNLQLQEQSEIRGTSDPKKHGCEKCGKVFTAPELLHTHLKSGCSAHNNRQS